MSDQTEQAEQDEHNQEPKDDVEGHVLEQIEEADVEAHQFEQVEQVEQVEYLRPQRFSKGAHRAPFLLLEHVLQRVEQRESLIAAILVQRVERRGEARDDGEVAAALLERGLRAP